MRELVAGARRRLAQGGFRPRAGHRRVGRPHRRRAPVRARRAALRRRAGHDRDAAIVRADVAAMAPEYMTEALEETAAGTIDFSRAWIACSI